jgi:hypothetical protein
MAALLGRTAEWDAIRERRDPAGMARQDGAAMVVIGDIISIGAHLHG